MKKPDQDVLIEAQQVAKSYARLREFFVLWYQNELEALPRAHTDVALKQGRCQVLAELTKLINPDPQSMLAKPVRTPVSTHTDNRSV